MENDCNSGTSKHLYGASYHQWISGSCFAVTPKDVTTHRATATEPTATPDSKATPPILETDVASASNGCTMLGIYGSYYSQAQKL